MTKTLGTCGTFCDPSFAATFWSVAGCVLLALAFGHCSGLSVNGRDLTVRVSVVSLSPAVVRIEGDSRLPSDRWSFRNTYGRVIGLGDRVDNFMVTDSVGNSIGNHRIGPADFKSEKLVSHFSYEVRVSEPSNPADDSHISWLNEQGGYLMLADLLPSIADEDHRSAGVGIEFQLPAHWDVVSGAQPIRAGQYEVPDPVSAVFFVGKDLRVQPKQIGGTEFVFASVGEWPFPIDSVTNTAARIIRDHARHVGFQPQGRAVLMLASSPRAVGGEWWTAETRGSSVVLLLGRNSPPDVLLGRLSIVLTHELFHLWVPGALSLDGDYDWFYEGFTLYQALRCAVRLGFIDFEEYLSTMARVYDSYLATTDRDRLSLVEASERRWTIGSSLAYEKGMLVAFLCDLSLRSASRNRRALDDVYRELFRERRSWRIRVNGNEALISLLNREQENEQFTRRYVLTASSVELETELPAYGLMVESSAKHTQLRVVQTLSSEQRQLLASLGYKRPRK